MVVQNLKEMRAILVREIDRAKAYRNPHEESPFAELLGTSPEYIRGGLDALKGVVRMIDEMPTKDES
jgi:hypothetical protein